MKKIIAIVIIVVVAMACGYGLATLTSEPEFIPERGVDYTCDLKQTIVLSNSVASKLYDAAVNENSSLANEIVEIRNVRISCDESLDSKDMYISYNVYIDGIDVMMICGPVNEILK